MSANSFHDDLSFSRGIRELTDLETLRKMIPGCVHVEKTGEDLDRLHVDYVAHLRRGAVLHIDGKTRRAGAARFWKRWSPGRADVPPNEPDLAIEFWSVKPTPSQCGRAGWTFDESSDTDLILYSFDPVDTNEVLLLSFPLLRIAARANCKEWALRFKLTTQRTVNGNGDVSWESECCLVPAVIVQDAIRTIERGSRHVSGLTSSPAVQIEKPKERIGKQLSELIQADIPWG